MIEIPEAFARYTTQREGETGRLWLTTVPGLVSELMRRWNCVLDGEIMHGGVGVIVPVLREADQLAAVLKVSFPHPGNVAEPDAFAAWDGHGAVRLYERADEHFAMLLERAGTHTLAESRAGDEVVTIAAQLGRKLATPARSKNLPRLSDRVEGWERELRQGIAELSTLEPEVVHAAMATVRELGNDQPELMVHGDLHPRNILAAEREPWLAVDPKGYVGDPAYDGGNLLKSHLFALLEEDDLDKAILRTVNIFSEAAELEHERVRRWAQFHAVEASLWGRRHGFRRARTGAELDDLTRLADHLARILM